MSSNDHQPPLRQIRSFVRREGRISATQERGLIEGWSQWGLSTKTGMLNYEAIFHRKAPIILEIGFGMGSSLLTMAMNEPEKDFIGVEVHRPGIGALLAGIEEKQLTNLRVFNEDAVEVLKEAIPDNSLARIQLYFPDPWPKRRHHKRRFIQPATVSLIAQKLERGGIFHAATDWEPYASHMLEVLLHERRLKNTVKSNSYTEKPDFRPLTKFEIRGQSLGHGIWDLLFYKNN